MALLGGGAVAVSVAAGAFGERSGGGAAGGSGCVAGPGGDSGCTGVTGGGGTAAARACSSRSASISSM